MVRRKVIAKMKRKMGSIIVEGSSDEVLLNALLQKTSDVQNMRELGFSVIYGTKQSQNNIIKDLARNQQSIIAFRDIDTALNKGRELRKCSIFIERNTELRCKIKGDTIHVSSGATIQIVPVGLAKDADLEAIGIRRHSMEDYLLKLIAIDKDVADWSELSLKELRNLALRKLKHKDPSRSKTILAALAMKKRLGYKEIVKEIVKTASLDNTIRVTKDLLIL